MKIEHDGFIEISTALSASSRTWNCKRVKWSALLEKLSNTVKTSETHNQFMSASKAEQSAIKDVGGFVGGRLINGRRTKNAVQYRQLLTLDIDYSTRDFFYNFQLMYDCAACIHGTHKSTPDNPRHRLIIPLSREVSPEEYEPIARRVASVLGIDMFDQSTYETNRLMYWPSTSCDIEYYFDYQDGAWLDADEVLATYTDWHNISEWPVASNYEGKVRDALTKQEDPRSKRGLIGAWCRTYTITDVIEGFLSDVYAPAGDNRYTYIAGTTAAGLVVYDDTFAYSHHGTDPCGGKLCNAYDLVRIHKFGHLDKGTEKEGAARPSDKAMEQLILTDKATVKSLGEERLAEAKYDFGGATPSVDAEATEEDTEWLSGLKANMKGEYENSSENINLILKNDKTLKDAFALNTFDNRRYLTRDMPWRSVSDSEPVRDVDYAGVRNYLDCIYGITGAQKIEDAVSLSIERNQYHPVRQYLDSLVWDGTPRVDTLLIDYFGAEDNAYTRATIRKSLCAAVARIYEPGTKYDMVPILVGPQGTYKSTFLRKLGGRWFSDTFTTVQGKEAFEQLQGSWIIELAELSAFKKSESESIKQFISKCDDMFRPAYGRTVEVYKRQCVFFGTTNDSDFLKDPTGSRRFNPIDIRPELATKSVPGELDGEVDQIWAEAVVLYRNGEPLYFTGEEASQATDAQESHSAIDERSGIIEDFLNLELPEDWPNMDLYDRRTWLNDPLRKKGSVRREVVTVAEVWCECLQRPKDEMSRYNTRDINDILRSMPNWEFVSAVRTVPGYGRQKYYRRKGASGYADLL